jgi:YD repeat-containing protein
VLQGLFRAIPLLGCAVGLWSSAAVDAGVPAAIVGLMASAQASEAASERSSPLGMVASRRAANAAQTTDTFTYDTAGRLARVVNSSQGTTNYGYDGASQLIRVDTPATDSVFWYDNDGQMVVEERKTGAVTQRIERFGPIQQRVDRSYVTVLPQLTVVLDGQGVATPRWTLSEPDGRASWVLDGAGGLVSEQLSTAYGLEYNAAVWGGVSTSAAWPLGGLHGAESDATMGVMHQGMRHMSMRGDGLWLQPEPLLVAGLQGTDPLRPLGYGPVYAAGNTNRWADRSGDWIHVVVGLVELGATAADLAVTGHVAGAWVSGTATTGELVVSVGTTAGGVYLPGGGGTVAAKMLPNSMVARASSKAAGVIDQAIDAGKKALGAGGGASRGVGAADDVGRMGSGLTNQTREQLLSSRQSYQDLITEHRQKLADYLADPMAHDNRGLLANAPSDAIREKIIAGRVQVLEGQIAKQEGELAKVNKLLGD